MIDRRERTGDLNATLQAAMEGNQANIWTSGPGRVISFNPAAMTCSVQPTIKGHVQQKDGTYLDLALPVLMDCPVLWQGGGGCTLTFPIKPNDECLVIFASRCIDSWWQQGGIQAQAELRMHDLSDGFVLCGVRCLPRAFAVDTAAVQLRTDDGTALVEINPTSKQIHAKTSGDILVEAAGTATIKAPSVLFHNGGTPKKLCNEDLIALYNSHTHGGGVVPDQLGSIDTQTTTITKAE